MKATVEIEFDESNAAFDGDNAERLRLINVAMANARVALQDEPPIREKRALVDRNGNKVGHVSITTH